MADIVSQMNESQKANYVLALLERAEQRRKGPPPPLPVFPELGKVLNLSAIRTFKARDGREIVPPTCQVFDLEKRP